VPPGCLGLRGVLGLGVVPGAVSDLRGRPRPRLTGTVWTVPSGPITGAGTGAVAVPVAALGTAPGAVVPGGAAPAVGAGAFAADAAAFLGLGFGGGAPSGKGCFRGRPRFRGVAAGC
jgi:hypothetical protein